ncbi:hypothetical protein BDZ45DRAFT_809093 [Acephala macrosclerotiorum]|nr:hypothetical protein BDZ45DRAFT_809093 [Acephala macrosclerotiorum]
MSENRAFTGTVAQSSPPKYAIYDRVLKYSGAVYHYLGKVSKFFSIALVADPEYQRELDCAFPKAKNPVNSSAPGNLDLGQSIPDIFHNGKAVLTTWKNLHRMEISTKRRRILIYDPGGVSTGFIRRLGNKTFQMLQYRGDHLSEPATIADLMATNTYMKTMCLLHRVETGRGKIINEYSYKYINSNKHKQLPKSAPPRTPISKKRTSGQDKFQDASYNMQGQIDSGLYIKDENLVRFKYHYPKGGKDRGALLRVEIILPYLSCMVSWCAPPRKNPERLDTWVTFVVGPDVWECVYIYDHKFHPTIITTLNGKKVDTPDLVAYDYLNVPKKPKRVSFLDDNPLFGFKSVSSNPITRFLEQLISDVKQATRALVNLNAHFKDSKNWSASTDNARPSSQWFNTEHPTLGQLDQGLELWSRYLFILSIPIPDKMPPVFQAPHHSVSASYDTILPCADFFNPAWEVEIGTCQGKIENRAAFRRKIDPVRFSPMKEIRNKNPILTMLSHIWYAEDIKTALLAADIIINESIVHNKLPEIIATKSLQHQVSMKGETDPIRVLEGTVFMNSIISEGLPLALSEAALTGAPVVCTDVGASIRVLTEPATGPCYSAVVAPNDARALASAQVKLLALLEEWSQYADPTAS